MKIIPQLKGLVRWAESGGEWLHVPGGRGHGGTLYFLLSSAVNLKPLYKHCICERGKKKRENGWWGRGKANP